MPQAAKLPGTSGFFPKKADFGEQVLPQAAKLPGTSGLFKKKTSHILRNNSAPGSEAARDKRLVQKKQVRFLRKSSAPGSEAARDKWLLQKNMFLLKVLPQAAKLPRTSCLFKKRVIL